MPELDLPPLDDDALRALLPGLVAGRRRLAELRAVPLEPPPRARLGCARLRLLADARPRLRSTVPTGRDVPLRYGAPTAPRSSR